MGMGRVYLVLTGLIIRGQGISYIDIFDDRMTMLEGWLNNHDPKALEVAENPVNNGTVHVHLPNYRNFHLLD